MNNRKREKLEIIKDILRTTLLNKNIRATQLLYKSNLSPKMFKYYTTLLINRNLIECNVHPGRTNLNKKEITKKYRIFKLTELGRQCLEDYKAVEMFLKKYGLNEEE